jgi:WXG100 family type VII secretion target
MVADLRVNPEVLGRTSEAFRSVAQELGAGLGSLDAEVSDPLGGSWTGHASSAYDAAWREWHEGASKVLQGLTTLSALLDEAAGHYSRVDEVGASSINESGVQS